MRARWITDGAIPGVVVTVSVATTDPRIVAEVERAAELNGVALRRLPPEPSPLAAFAAGWTDADGSDDRREELLRPLYEDWAASLLDWPSERLEAPPGAPPERAPDARGLLWLLGHVGDATVSVSQTDTWIRVAAPAGYGYAILRWTGAVYEINPDGSVPDDPIFTPA